MDFCKGRHLARSQLEAGRHRSRCMIGRRAMRRPARRLSIFLFAALPVLAAATDPAAARRHEPAPPQHTVAMRAHAKPGINPQVNLRANPQANPQANPPVEPARSAVHPGVDPGIEPLRIPNAALEPAGWNELDGWTVD